MAVAESKSAGKHVARWWETMADGRLHCYLCPRHCHIGEGQHGFCFIRKNEGGELIQLGYGRPAAIAMDPVEKKPLNHFFPGTKILSMGTAGCNMGCQFCQNFDISKAKADHVRSVNLSPGEVVETALEHGAPHLAFTYNEPTIWGEYVIDIAREAHGAGLNNVMVSNGYITREAFFDIYQHIDAANIDLKGFTEKFYSKITLSHMQPVLDTLRWLRHETDVWFEITNLVIPTLNDEDTEFKELIDWVLSNLGDDVPLHFTAFHPDFKLLDKPATPAETLHKARRMAMRMGLKYVYEGNIFSDGGDTICPGCRKRVIRRSWHAILADDVVNGACRHCGTSIAGVFTRSEVERRRGPQHLRPKDPSSPDRQAGKSLL